MPSASVRRSGAWSCVVDGQLFERCFTAQSPGFRAVCEASPFRPGAFSVELPETLVSSVIRPERGNPWLLVLEDGTTCATVRGAPVNEDGDRVTYECDDGTFLLGPVQRTHVFYALQAEASGLWLQTVSIESAWF